MPSQDKSEKMLSFAIVMIRTIPSIGGSDFIFNGRNKDVLRLVESACKGSSESFNLTADFCLMLQGSMKDVLKRCGLAERERGLGLGMCWSISSVGFRVSFGKVLSSQLRLF